MHRTGSDPFYMQRLNWGLTPIQTERQGRLFRDTMPPMQIGIILPQNEFGSDPGVIREFAQAAESRGFAHAVAFDHVVGKDDYASQPFHEPFVLFGFLAACTSTIELVTGIIILPQRQTALAAKQAAEVDMLSGGRLRLGLGVGWNPLEYEALGEDFHTRGKRMDAQIPLMQRLWTERHVSGGIEREQFADVGLNPPAIRSIPIWLGGKGPAAVRRAVAWGSGLILSRRGTDPEGVREFVEVRDRLYEAADAAGRPRAELGIEVWLATKDGDPESWRAAIEQWAELGATHVSIETYAQEPISPETHITRVGLIAEAVFGS
jgi:probable F420-dependent oxidoreductase